jgi:hypothetical protein
MSDMIEKLKAFLETDEGKESIKKFNEDIAFKEELKNRNIKRVRQMFNDQESFDKLVTRILEKHNDNWRDHCYKKGVMPYPWELLYSLFDLAETQGKEIDAIDNFTEMFTSSIYTYNDWQFAITYGQGSVCSVYYKKELMYRD